MKKKKETEEKKEEEKEEEKEEWKEERRKAKEKKGFTICKMKLPLMHLCHNPCHYHLSLCLCQHQTAG